MKNEQLHWTSASGWSGVSNLSLEANIVLVFGGVDEINNNAVYGELRKVYPQADIVLASTAGEIIGSRVFDNTIVSTAIFLEKTPHRIVSLDVHHFKNSFDCGQEIQRQLLQDDLCHILILSEGTKTNGDELVNGINYLLPPQIIVTGGLAADAGRFIETYVGVNENPQSGRIAAIGFYGPHLKVTHGSQGGWDEFGPQRRVTKSKGNILFSLDDTPALELYKKYLGTKANELPGAALLFPLCILENDGSKLVRTILSIDERDASMTFAGDVPQGSRVQFMMANFDRLVDGAVEAAEISKRQMFEFSPELVLMISCVGRKIVLNQRIEEEVESVTEIFGNSPTYCGFYSNGEISPLQDSAKCSLHNQTMTITTYCEM